MASPIAQAAIPTANAVVRAAVDDGTISVGDQGLGPKLSQRNLASAFIAAASKFVLDTVAADLPSSEVGQKLAL